MSDEYNIMNEYLTNIMERDYPILDVGETIGSTGYIDYIRFNDLTAPIMKGYDKYERPFFVIRAIITKSDGSTLKTMETFFQRYSDNKNLWHGCGLDGPYFLSTFGGMNIKQINFIEKLLENKKVDLTDDLMNNICFGIFIKSYNETDPKLISIELY
jgi:hypothetical protein